MIGPVAIASLWEIDYIYNTRWTHIHGQNMKYHKLHVMKTVHGFAIVCLAESAQGTN